MEHSKTFLEGKVSFVSVAERFRATGKSLLQYGNDAIAVRVLSEGGIWFAEVADIAGRPEEWYDAEIIRDLVKGTGSQML